MPHASTQIADPLQLLGTQQTDTTLARRFGVTKAVYSLVYPETRALLEQLWISCPHVLFDHAYLDRQDGAEDVFVDRWATWALSAVGDVTSFSHRYATSGSSESIRESIWMLTTHENTTGQPRIHVFDGEYEGYSAYAGAAGVQTIVHDRHAWRDSLQANVRDGDRWYVSQPSAIDGMIWHELDDWLEQMSRVAPGCRVMLDLTYVGATPRPLRVNATHPQVHTIFFSLSKVFGVYYHRIGGCLSREAMPGLYGNRWFKNMFSLHLGMELMARHELFTLPEKYRCVQAVACAALSARLGAPNLVRPSDAVMLARIEPDAERRLPPELEPLRRAQRHRLCLTPMMTELLSQETRR